MTPKEAKERVDEDLRAVLGLPAGRRFFVRLLTQAGLYSPSFASDAQATAYNEGRRSVAIALLREAQRVTPQQYARALREQLEEDAKAATPDSRVSPEES